MDKLQYRPIDSRRKFLDQNFNICRKNRAVFEKFNGVNNSDVCEILFINNDAN